MPNKIIDPENLSSQDAHDLFHFFQSSKNKIWFKNQTYYLADQTEISFQNKVFQRERKEGKEGFRYEFIGNKTIGKGGQGKVVNIEGTLAIDESHAEFKKKPRVVKIQVHKDLNPQIKAEDEYNMMLRAGYLKPKKPFFFQHTSFMVQTWIKGKELFDIIGEDEDGISHLSLKKRIDLSMALLLALKEQVTDKGLLHRDIKPENILVIMNEPIEVYIIDFGLSRLAEKDDQRWPGTPHYAAPEIFLRSPLSFKTDVFSLGRILALIWGIDRKTYHTKKFEENLKNSMNQNLDRLFTYPDLNYLSPEIKLIVHSTLIGMLKKDVKDRPSIDEAIDSFQILTKEERPELIL